MAFTLSDDNPLHSFQDLGLPITWTLVKMGRDGPGDCRPQLSAKNVREYAAQLLECDPLEPWALQVLVLRDEEIDELDQTIHDASAQERLSDEAELSKWMVVRLLPILDGLPTVDPIEGLYWITDFWCSFDFPENSPYESHKELPPADFYSWRNYESLISSHREWAGSQISRLRSQNKALT